MQKPDRKGGLIAQVKGYALTNVRASAFKVIQSNVPVIFSGNE
jgi:hypothetical protein